MTERLLKSTLSLYHDSAAVPLQNATEQQRVFGSTAATLASLSNPLNISLVVSHFLTAPAIWGSMDASSGASSAASSAPAACFRVISLFNTAAIHVHRHEREEQAAARHGLVGAAAYRLGVREDRRPGCEDWARAVAQGADGKSPRWRHVLVLVGVLLGLESSGRRSLSRSRRAALEQGVVAAANLALAEDADNVVARYAVVSGLNYAFPLLSAHARAMLDCDLLLPAAIDMLAGPFGFDGGRVLALVAADPQVRVSVSVSSNKLEWPASSASFQALQQRETDNVGSLVPSAGPVAAMAVFAIERAASPMTVLQALTTLFGLAESTAQHWSACGVLSGLDLSVAPTATAANYLTPETATTTWPLLWRHLQKMLYAVATLLQAIVGRSLLDRVMASDGVAPGMAAKVLRVLHNLDFVATYNSNGVFQAHRFAYLASIDILTRYPDASAAFLAQIRPMPALTAAAVAVDNLPPARVAADLFYLDLAEHFAGVLPTAACEGLIVQPALPYIVPTNTTTSTLTASPRMVAVFEAAHSAVLSVFKCAHNAPIAAALAPFYADALFASFPTRVSSLQFRFAFKTLIQILSPPFAVYATHPDLAETLLEMVRYRAVTAASSQVLPPSRSGEDANDNDAVSEQSALVLTLIDALPFLALPVLEYWMTTAAETVWAITGSGPVDDGGPGSASALRQVVQRRFWEVLGSGEMDVERAAMGVAWWGNGGGGELVMRGVSGMMRRGGGGGGGDMMSGALPNTQCRL